MGEYAVQVERLEKRYRDREALKDVSFRLEAGTVTALLGPEGAGKTTLIRILAGMAFPDGGTVSLFGSSDAAGLRAARQQTGFLADAAFGKRSFNVEKNLILLAGLYGKPDRRYIRKLMRRLHIAEQDVGRKRIGTLLEVAQARYALAAALAHKPRLLILDEPLEELHTDDLETVYSLLRELREEGTTMLLSGRSPARLRHVCSQALLLEGGVLTGPVPMDALGEE
jgi:ABC-2 type transport system ATP-binding protein